MKKIIFILLFLTLSISVFSQEGKHLLFKNTPIDGTLSDFVRKMEKEGFIISEIQEDVAVLEGEFTNRNCIIFVTSSPKSKIVWKVNVLLLPKENTWYKLESDYYNYVKQYTKKYGKPTKSFEFFSEPYYAGDGYELQALDKDKCTYASFWQLKNGTICVSIGGFTPSIGGHRIFLIYEDELNSNIAELEEEGEIQNEI